MDARDYLTIAPVTGCS